MGLSMWAAIGVIVFTGFVLLLIELWVRFKFRQKPLRYSTNVEPFHIDNMRRGGR